MKFEELIMQETREKQKTMQLQEEVDQLEAELEDELKLSKTLQYALDGPIHPCFSTHLPFKIKELLTELATVEEEIMWLERKVNKLNLSLYLEKKETREWEFRQLRDLHPQSHNHHHRPRKHTLRRQQNRAKFMSYELQDYDSKKSFPLVKQRRSFHGSSIDIKHAKLQLSVLRTDDITKNPNKLSEDLIKCLIGIFLELNQPLIDSEEGSDIVPKHISCMNSKSFISKTAFNCTCTPPTFFFNNNASNLDPYATLLDSDYTIRDIGPYKTFTQITRNTLDHTRISECSKEVGKLRILMQKLCNVELNLLTYKQKLAFWINIYNACIMHAFLQHGLPSTQEKLLVLMNKVHLIKMLIHDRNPKLKLYDSGSNQRRWHCGKCIRNRTLHSPVSIRLRSSNEREMLLRQTYGLGFPEPNVSFGLCRGSWSSPALRVYTAEDIVNELARARVEYLEASVGVVSKKKMIMIPKLLQWHIKDFADDMESLLEWIYSELPQSGTGSLKRLIMECLNGDTKSSPAKMIEIQPYVYEFRYLLPRHEIGSDEKGLTSC
ncbi:uncharacterized protein LOC111905752 isoform X1 [Lactuca sativa]|uniref:uncharacterized protein LOC111905752 isoform X1 n=1 Tax=Lactuca sativa TaxID=4236 RepID=UPI000CD7E423|nr:uncharacterized protein LOC111905752 isoform X1 [Lactuca sativa]